MIRITIEEEGEPAEVIEAAAFVLGVQLVSDPKHVGTFVTGTPSELGGITSALLQNDQASLGREHLLKVITLGLKEGKVVRGRVEEEREDGGTVVRHFGREVQ